MCPRYFQVVIRLQKRKLDTRLDCIELDKLDVDTAVTIDRQPVKRIAITGIGVYCPIGESKDEMLTALKEARGAVEAIRGFNTDGLKVSHAAEIASHRPSECFEDEATRQLDWTAQFAILAAQNAANDSGLSKEDLVAGDTGLIAGVCAGGQGDSPEQRDQQKPFQYDVSRYQEVSHYRQTDAVGGILGMHGPRMTVSTACASSTTALGHAYDWLQSGVARRVLIGGMDAFSITTYAGFYALGAMAEAPISPFSDGIGVTFGEGAGFVVLELLDDAQERGANIYGELYGHGDSGDAHHITAPAPSGEGLARAMSRAMKRAGLDASQIDYVNAHGTGTRDNDTAESIAIASALGEAPTLPPVSSTKSYFGHTLGAAGILEFISSILASREGFLLPTLNHTGNRPGCDHDYIPNQPRKGKVRAFLSNSAAFGGINATVAAGEVRQASPSVELELDEVWITGRGVVSPIGCGLDAFRQGLKNSISGIRPIDRFDTTDMSCSYAGMVEKFKPRKLVPTIDARRAEILNRYAMVAAGLAMQDAKVDTRVVPSERFGMVMGLMYGSISVQEDFNNSLINDGLEQLSAKYFPSMVISTIGGQVSQSFSLRGTNTTIVDGFTGGLNALIQGYDLLRQDDELDAVVVVVSDEIGRAMFDVYEKEGKLTPDSLKVYSPEANGIFLGEGAASVVLERASAAKARGANPLAKIAGFGMTSDAVGPVGTDDDGIWCSKAIEQSLRQSELAAEDVQLIYGHGCGDTKYDSRELAAISRVLGSADIPLANIVGNIGFCGASSGLFSVIAASLSIEYGERYPAIGCAEESSGVRMQIEYSDSQSIGNALIVGSTENGNNAAVVLKAVESS